MYIPSLLSALLATTLVHAIPLEDKQKSYLEKRSAVCNSHDITLLKSDIKKPVVFCESWLGVAKHTTTPVKGLSLKSASAACSCVTSSAKSVAAAAAKKTSTKHTTTTTKKATTTTKHTTTTKKATTTVKHTTTSTKKATTSVKKATTSTKKPTTTTKKTTTTSTKKTTTTTSTKKTTTTTSTKKTTTTPKKITTTTKAPTTTSKTTTKAPTTTAKVTTTTKKSSTTSSKAAPTTVKSPTTTKASTTNLVVKSSSLSSSRIIVSSSSARSSSSTAAVATHAAVKELITNGNFTNKYTDWDGVSLDTKSSASITNSSNYRAVLTFPASTDCVFALTQNLAATYVKSNYTLSMDLYPNYPSGLPAGTSMTVQGFGYIQDISSSDIDESYQWFTTTLTSANGTAAHVSATISLDAADDVSKLQVLYLNINVPSRSAIVTLGINNVDISLVATSAVSTTTTYPSSSATSHSSNATYTGYSNATTTTHSNVTTSAYATATAHSNSSSIYNISSSSASMTASSTVSSASANATYSSNLIQNGDFATGDYTNWSTYSVSGGTTARIFGSNSSNYRALFNFPAGQSDGDKMYLSQTLQAIPASATYIVTADLYPNYPSGLTLGQNISVDFQYHTDGSGGGTAGTAVLNSTLGAGPYPVEFSFVLDPTDASKGYTSNVFSLLAYTGQLATQVTLGLDNFVVKLAGSS